MMVIVIAILVLSLAAGLRAGFFSSLGSLVGLIGGALLVPWAVPAVTSVVSDPSWRWLAGVVTIAVLLLVASAIGSSLGSLVRHGTDRLKLRVPERIMGGVVSTMVAAVAVSLVGTGVASAGIPGLSAAVSSSATLRAVDDLLPDRLRQAGDEVRAALFDETFLPSIPGTSVPTTPPGRGSTSTDAPVAPLPDADTESPALVTASESVARISGIASACRMMPTGSGFVAADNRVVTNAHVVAGVDAPVVTLQDGQAADGRVVYFNEDDDIAVIAADLDARPPGRPRRCDSRRCGCCPGLPRWRTVPVGECPCDHRGPDAVRWRRGRGTAVCPLRSPAADRRCPRQFGWPLPHSGRRGRRCRLRTRRNHPLHRLRRHGGRTGTRNTVVCCGYAVRPVGTVRGVVGPTSAPSSRPPRKQR